MASGKAGEAPANSYLGKYLARGIPPDDRSDGDDEQQCRHPEEDTYCPNGYTNTAFNNEERHFPSGGKISDDLHCRPDKDGGSDDHDAHPRSPPRGPTAQPPSPQRTHAGPRWMLDSGTLIESGAGSLGKTLIRHYDMHSPGSKGQGDSGGGVGSTSHHRQALGNGGRRSHQRKPQQRQRQRQRPDFVLDEHVRQPSGQGAAKAYSVVTTSVNTRGQQQTNSTGFSLSRPRNQRLGGRGGSTLFPRGQGSRRDRTDNKGNGDGRALSARESSALFWEESDSLHAKSAIENNEWGVGLGRSREEGRRSTLSCVTAPPSSVAPAVGRCRKAPSNPAVRGGGPGGGLEQEGGGSSKFFGRTTAYAASAAAAAAAGGSAFGARATRIKHPLTAMKHRELSLAQALRTVGGLVGGDGAKVSAVGKHITSIDGVPSGVSSRAVQLFLSNNSLQSLHGLEAFSGVACLSLSHNLLRRAEDLRSLASLARLETLSLEGNPVCRAANYRAHVVSLASSSLKTLDRRAVTPAEASDAPAIVAAERSAKSKTSKVRCLCLLLDHMCGSIKCHAELREPLLRAGGGNGNGDSSDRVSSRFWREGGVSGGWRGVWRQRPAAVMPVRQMLTVLGAETWPVFDRSELDVLERQVLDEAVEVFAEVVASRRLAGQRTHELSEGAVATLDSHSTRTWTQVLGEVHRRTVGSESDIILRLEGFRRREAERFRHVSAQTNAFLQELATSVGYSDNHWSVPACAAAVAAVRRQRNGASERRNTKTKDTPEPARPVRASGSLLLPSQGRGDGRAALNAITRSYPTAGIAAGGNPTADHANESQGAMRSREGRSQQRLETASVDQNHSGLGDERHKTRGDRRCFAVEADKIDPPSRAQCTQKNKSVDSRARSEAKVESHRSPAVGSLQDGRVELPREEGLRELIFFAETPSSAAVASRIKPGPSPPSEFGGVTIGTAMPAAAAAAPATATHQTPTTNMASAARFLLARELREDVNQKGRGSSGASPPPTGASQASAEEVAAADGDEAPSKEELLARGEYTSGIPRRAGGVWKRGYATVQPSGRPDSRTVRDGLNRREAPPNLERTRPLESPARCGRSGEAGGVLPGSGPSARPVSPPAGECEYVAVCATDPASDSLRTATGERQLFCSPHHGRVVCDGDDAGRRGGRTRGDDAPHEDEGDAFAAAGRRGSSSEATRRLLREAQRVKRLLAAMDKADAASATGTALGDQDPERYLASLGFVEIKPLSTKLAEALDRPPQAPSFGDPSVAAPEPRTTRGLRDRVAALGKEVARRAEACAEARKVHVALRKHIEVARRGRARNLDVVDAACRTLIAKAGEEVQVLQESRRVAQEAERYHATLASLQEQEKATIRETRRVISGSEAVAWKLREEMQGRGGELGDRRRVAEEGLAEWEKAATTDPDLRARRRAYDCEILVLRHRMGCDGANGASLAAAFRLLRARTTQQRRAREWFARATARREALLVRSAFDALARGSRSRAAAAAASTARCRAVLATWRGSVSMSRRLRTFRWGRERAAMLKGLRRWRQRCEGVTAAVTGGSVAHERGAAAERKEALAWRLELFRERRAKRVLFRVWRGATQIAAEVATMKRRAEGRELEGLDGWGHDRWGRRRLSRPCANERGELTPCPEWGARLRTAEAVARRRWSDSHIGRAFRWWRRYRQCNVLARTAERRRALQRWRRWLADTRSAREATMEARASYVISLGKRVLAAWSTAAATRARRRTAAASLELALSAIMKRINIRRWAFQVAAAAFETDSTIAALEHHYERCLRGHLRAWSVVAKERRILRRGVELLLRGGGKAKMAVGLRIWRQKVAKVREAHLRQHRIKAWAAAAARRRRLRVLSLSFSAWACKRRRIAVMHSLTVWAAGRRRRLALAGGFRALCLSRRRDVVNAAASALREAVPGGPGDGDRRGRRVVADEAAVAVEEAVAEKAVMEGKLGELRARLAQEKVRALERRAAASEVAEEVARSERERARYAKILRSQVNQPLAISSEPTPPFAEETSIRAGIGPAGSCEGWPFPRKNGLLTEQHGGEESGGGKVVPPVSPKGRVQMSDLAEREGELFGKLQAETLELKQKAAAAKKQREQLKEEAARKAAAMTAALESALAKGEQLQAEADQRKALITRLDEEAQHTVGQAAALSERLAGAEQDLGFEAIRNNQRLCARAEGNARLRAAASAAEKRLAVAEIALRRKEREIEDLRVRCAREGLGGGGGGGPGKDCRGRGSGGSRKNAGDSAGDLGFRVFAAAADARSSVERCTVIAAERRAAAGSGLAEAMRTAGSEPSNGKRLGVDCSGDDDDDDAGAMASARRLVADSVADERREVAELVLRSAEAKLRRSADLSLRASLERRPLANPRSLLAERSKRRRKRRRRRNISVNEGGGHAAFHPETKTPSVWESDSYEGVVAFASDSNWGETEEGPVMRLGGSRRMTQRSDEELDGAAPRTPRLEAPRACSPPGGMTGGERRGSVHGTYSDTLSERGRSGGSRRRNERDFKEEATRAADDAPGDIVAEDGLRELKREILDLEGKIMGRLGSGGGDGGGNGSDSGSSNASAGGSGVDESSDGGKQTGSNLALPSESKDAKVAAEKNPARGRVLGSRRREALSDSQLQRQQLQPPRQQQQQQQQWPPVPPPTSAAASSSSLSCRRVHAGLSPSTHDYSARERSAKRSLCGSKRSARACSSARGVGTRRHMERKSRAMSLNPVFFARVSGSFGSASGVWEGISAISSGATSPSSRNRGSGRRKGERGGPRPNRVGLR